MSASDVEAVTARRAVLISEKAKLEQDRLDLLAEDQDLEVAERVLRRLGELHYGEPLSVEDLPSNETPGALQSIVERGLSSGRRALDILRSAVERRTS